MSEPILTTFTDLGLSPPLLQALGEVGYESPSPIQAATIPLLLANRDVLGQAQTGTGKTAAFALPVLSCLVMKKTTPQALVLVPTRELALQVAEAFQRYATHLQGFHVLPIYGGQSYGPQLAALKRGVHVVVGTPGRVIDHLEKGSLDLSALRTLVLDEADEMLRMGFAEDVERILQDTPKGRQTALFSATMPVAIKRIAQTHLREPAEVTVAAKTGTADNIRQRYWLVSGMHKLDALTRILEAEAFDAMIVFARTKLGTEELAGKLQARGFAAVAINGDLQQQQRERIIGQIKDGTVDILVATDVAARGLDVERISHVINFDVPTDPESYTHRIGRTGRAGRSGEAILFITPRERGLLRAIERSTRQPIALMELPSIQAVNNVRIARFKAEITATLAEGELERYTRIIEDYEREHNVPAIEVAAALAKMSRGGVPLLIDRPKRDKRPADAASPEGQAPIESAVPQTSDTTHTTHTTHTDTARAPVSRLARFDSALAPVPASRDTRSDAAQPTAPRPMRRTAASRPGEVGLSPFRVEVGYASGIKAGNLVGAIANEAQIDSKFIGRIEILETHSFIELPADLPKKRLKHLQTVRVGGQTLRISEVESMPAPARKPRSKPTSRG